MRTAILTDIYGTLVLDEPVLFDLLSSKAVQRVKGVAQSGLLDAWNGGRNFSRYDHCVGTMLLLRKVGASLEEQIAGLLHDVSHTAFSHVIDWVIGDSSKQDYQDRTHADYIMRTELPDLLKKHSIPLAAATDPHHYSLLEQPTPELCADRVDYTLRCATLRGHTTQVQHCIPFLTAHYGRLVFMTGSAAEEFYHLYRHFQETEWGRPSGRYHLLASALRAALENKIVALEDFYQNDAHMMRKLRASSHEVIVRSLHLLDHGYTLVRDDVHPDYIVQEKLRYVDPTFLEDGKVLKVSDILPGYTAWLEEAQRQSRERRGMRIVPKDS